MARTWVYEGEYDNMTVEVRYEGRLHIIVADVMDGGDERVAEIMGMPYEAFEQMVTAVRELHAAQVEYRRNHPEEEL